MQVIISDHQIDSIQEGIEFSLPKNIKEELLNYLNSPIQNNTISDMTFVSNDIVGDFWKRESVYIGIIKEGANNGYLFEFSTEVKKNTESNRFEYVVNLKPTGTIMYLEK